MFKYLFLKINWFTNWPTRPELRKIWLKLFRLPRKSGYDCACIPYYRKVWACLTFRNDSPRRHKKTPLAKSRCAWQLYILQGVGLATRAFQSIGLDMTGKCFYKESLADLQCVRSYALKCARC